MKAVATFSDMPFIVRQHARMCHREWWQPEGLICPVLLNWFVLNPDPIIHSARWVSRFGG